MDTRRRSPGPRPISHLPSPGRRAGELRPRGARILLPFLYLVLASLGLVGVVAVPAGLWTRTQLLKIAATLSNLPFVGAPPIPTITWWILAGSAVLLIVGLAGLWHESRLERDRQRLIEEADRRIASGRSSWFDEAA
jgi:hypothetical protein